MAGCDIMRAIYLMTRYVGCGDDDPSSERQSRPPSPRGGKAMGKRVDEGIDPYEGDGDMSLSGCDMSACGDDEN